MNPEEDDMGANTISDGAEQGTKVLMGTRESLQRQRWRTHVGHVMSRLATEEIMILDSMSSGDDDNDDNGGGGGGYLDDGNDAVRPASIPLVDGVRGSP